ncbi:DUF4135 domain-containing protein [Clostridium sp.]|uniref:DUF4135 domain-containing protein n=1 Tax=Clostridium sp. TaxID=1506 RepID=UPI00260308A8|nr:DUF4135 domain-containing protein [Clostridium sp.]
MLSKLKPCNDVEKIINEILIDRYFTPVTVAIVNDFFGSITNIVSNKEEFLRDILGHFNSYKVKENKIKDYLNLANIVMNLAEKNFLQLEKDILKEDGLKIKKMKVFLNNETAVLTFTDGSEVLFFKESILKKYSLFNDIIYYLNNKIIEENNLQIRKIINCRKYGFLEVSEVIKENDLFKYYFKSGELLAVLYLLCCKNTEELFTLANFIKDNNFSASNIARHILKISVFTIDFLPLDKMNLVNSNIESIKSGFEYMYNIMVSNKTELIYFIKKIFINNIKYLGNILTKLNILNKEDLKMQLCLIDARFLKNEFYRRQITFSNNKNPGSVDRKRFIELVDSLGDHLIKKSIIGYSNGNISRTWINLILPDYDRKSEVSDSVYNLHDENSRVALFFVYLGELTKKKYFINVALEIMQESMDSMNNIDEYSKIIVYELFTLSKIYSITKSETIKSAINKGIFSIYKIIKESDKDYISISHAAIILSIYDVIECNKTKKIIVDLGNILHKDIKFNDKCEEILFFLIKLMSITQDKKIECTIKRLLDIERKTSSNKNYSEILINRLKLKELQYNDNLIDEEINEALNYIIKNGFENNSYCYNEEIINIEVLEYAAEILGNESLKNRCINTYNNLVNKIIEPAIYEEIHYGNKSISLMKGIVDYGCSLIRKCSDRRSFTILSFQGIVCIDYGRN